MKALKVKDTAGNIYYVKGNTVTGQPILKNYLYKKDDYSKTLKLHFFTSHSAMVEYAEKTDLVIIKWLLIVMYQLVIAEIIMFINFHRKIMLTILICIHIEKVHRYVFDNIYVQNHKINKSDKLILKYYYLIINLKRDFRSHLKKNKNHRIIKNINTERYS